MDRRFAYECRAGIYFLVIIIGKVYEENKTKYFMLQSSYGGLKVSEFNQEFISEI